MDKRVDKSEDFKESGMTLITEVDSEKYLRKAQKMKDVKEGEIFDNQEDHFVLICQTKHIEDGLLNIDYLKSLGNNIDILSVRDWKKLGPAYEILLMEDILSTSEECIISYCDYFVDWDYKLFLKGIKDKNFAGPIPCYQGFHPHLLDETHLLRGVSQILPQTGLGPAGILPLKLSFVDSSCPPVSK